MSILLHRDPKEMRQWRKGLEGSVGFIPTMGALHEGHLSLVHNSMRNNDHTVVSIFVNPTQFNDPKDLENYPRTLEGDLELLSSAGASCCFAPSASLMYPGGFRYKVTEKEVSRFLCGKDRPGHFDGVLTVVMKLLNIVAADRAYFGEKDYQQLKLIEGMSREFFLDTKIVPCPTFRDDWGLALSSRNKLLAPQEKEKAPVFSKILKEATSRDEAISRLKKEGFDVVYVDELWERRFGAVKLGAVRLIDNVAI